MRTATRLVEAPIQNGLVIEFDEIEVIVSNGNASEKRRKWLLENGFRCPSRTVEGVKQAWIMAKAGPYSYTLNGNDRAEMDAIEYFNPYE